MNTTPEKPEDIPFVRVINERAFEQPAEADIVDKLRLSCLEALSLVAVDENPLAPITAVDGAPFVLPDRVIYKKDNHFPWDIPLVIGD